MGPSMLVFRVFHHIVTTFTLDLVVMTLNAIVAFLIPDICPADVIVHDGA
jgi:hypothetical protein